MPSLRAHLVFMAELREALVAPMPQLAAVVDAHWPAALLGSVGPDAWYFSGQTRPQTHGLDTAAPSTWPGAIERWLAAHPECRPGRSLPPETAAFLAGYLSHLGLDTWEQYQHDDFPREARARLPAAWFPPALAERQRRQASLRALGEAPFRPDLLVTPEQLQAAPVPPGFDAAATRRIAAGIAAALPLADPWAISRISPLRAMPDTPEERRRWEAQRAAVPPATEVERRAVLHSALALTLAAIRSWW
jgi:hypothetical protein